jgi:hypothetical protein
MQPADPTEEQPVDEQHIPAPRSAPTNDAPEPEKAEPEKAEPEKVEPEKAAPDGLGERDLAILAFEARWWKHAGAKEQAIRDTFALSSTRYYQLLNALLDNPVAMEQDPVLVGRLRRLRSTRARTRRR